MLVESAEDIAGKAFEELAGFDVLPDNPRLRVPGSTKRMVISCSGLKAYKTTGSTTKYKLP